MFYVLITVLVKLFAFVKTTRIIYQWILSYIIFKINLLTKYYFLKLNYFNFKMEKIGGQQQQNVTSHP